MLLEQYSIAGIEQYCLDSTLLLGQYSIAMPKQYDKIERLSMNVYFSVSYTEMNKLDLYKTNLSLFIYLINLFQDLRSLSVLDKSCVFSLF